MAQIKSGYYTTIKDKKLVKEVLKEMDKSMKEFEKRLERDARKK